MLFRLIGWCVFGLIAGAIARMLVPGRDPMGCLATIALGVAGSILGGVFGHVLFGGSGHAGWVLSILTACGILLLTRDRGPH